MDINKIILAVAESKRTFSTNDVLKALKNRFSRAYVLQVVRRLVAQGKLVKGGSTKNALYSFPKNRLALGNVFDKRYKNKDLKEHEVLEDFRMKLFFLRELSEHIQSIFDYAFSEMLNNAIEHSKSENISVKVEKKGETVSFIVDDFGIGVFRNIMKKRKLKSPLEAIQDLLKGKTTTMPHAHSGEGIFFTSKVADVFVLDSYGFSLRVDNVVDDVFVSDSRLSKKGTRVAFEISANHKGHLDDVFKKYYTDSGNFAFDKTEIRIKLYTMGSVYVSRSQARRVLSGLEKFRTVILDFESVPGVGQAFADEIFRVFKAKYPKISILPENMNESVRFMVERVGE